MYVYLTEEEFLWKMQEWTDWTLSSEATSAIYEKYEGEQVEREDIATEYFSAIEMSVYEIFEKCRDKFATEEETYEYLQSNFEIEIEEEMYDIDLEFDNGTQDKNFILIKQ